MKTSINVWISWLINFSIKVKQDLVKPEWIILKIVNSMPENSLGQSLFLFQYLEVMTSQCLCGSLRRRRNQLPGWPVINSWSTMLNSGTFPNFLWFWLVMRFFYSFAKDFLSPLSLSLSLSFYLSLYLYLFGTMTYPRQTNTRNTRQTIDKINIKHNKPWNKKC